MTTCIYCTKGHEIVFEEYEPGHYGLKSCPVCEAEAEIRRHEICAEKLRATVKDLVVAIENAIESLKICTLPWMSTNVASNEELIKITCDGLRAAKDRAEGRS